MDEITILHMADCHLGGSGPAFGERVRRHQQLLIDAYARALEIARVERVDAVCIVGDLFYNPWPSERTFAAMLDGLRSLRDVSPPIPCFILPGNHDCVGPASIWHRPELSLEGVYVWREPGSVRLPDGSAAFHGNPQPCDVASHVPLAGLEPDPSARFNVALAHGAVVIPGLNETEAWRIETDQIAGCAMDYVALGHWHDAGDYSAGGVPAHFPGATEIVNVAQRDPGGVYLVTLGPNGVRLRRERTGVLRTETLELSPELQPDEQAVYGAIRAMSDENLLLDVVISGLAPDGFTLDLARLQEELEPGFFRLRIKDETVPVISELDPHSARSQMIAARAVSLFRERIEQAVAQNDTEAERLATKAMQLALALFQGKDVLP